MMDKNKLNEILDKHKKWLLNMEGGERANLRGCNLSRSDLRGSDLSGSNLSGSNLSRCDLSGSNLSGSNLSRCDLSGSDLSGSNLSGSDLRGSDLRGANLSRSDLRGSDLSGSNLSGSNLSGSDLRGAKIEIELLNKFFPICCPEHGSFIAWKKASGYIVKLKVTENAKRSSAYGRKCRCSEAKVLAIENPDGTTARMQAVKSGHDSTFIYRVGETVRVDNFDDDRRNECAPGIHFFITRQEAVDY